jgi:hypothetical protein
VWYFTNGCVFRGELNKKNGKPHGNGVQIYLDGSIYEGSFQFGKRSSKKAFYKTLDGIICQGTFENDAPEGDFSEYKKGEILFDGEMKAGIKHGKGKMTFPNGHNYNGEFFNGMMSHGKYNTFSSGYEGSFKDN